MIDSPGGNTEDRSGFVTREPEKALEQVCRRMEAGGSVLVIISGEITDNPEAMLQGWSEALFRRQLLGGKQPRMLELLPILSSDTSVETFTEELLLRMQEAKQLCLINGFHQYDYNILASDALLRLLFHAFSENRFSAPVILHVPAVVLQEVLRYRILPGMDVIQLLLSERATPVPVSTRSSPAVPAEAEQPHERQQETPPVITHEPEKPEPQKEESFAFNEGDDKPWYVREPALLKNEKDGIVRFLQNTSGGFVWATLENSKRIYLSGEIRFSSQIYDFFINLKLIYGEDFSAQKPDILVALPDEDKGTLKFLRKRAKKVTDPELGEVFIIKPCIRGRNTSKAVAVLEGLVSLLCEMR